MNLAYYKDAAGEVHALMADGSQDDQIAVRGLTRMSSEEERAHLHPDKSLQELASTALALVNAEYDRHIEIYINSFPLGERLSWPTQSAEAAAVLAGDEGAMPWIDAAILHRGVSRVEMAEKIKRKADMFSAASGTLSGIRQWHEDCIGMLLEDGEDARTELEGYNHLQGWEPEVHSPDESAEIASNVA